MNKLCVASGILSLALSLLGQAQEIKSLVPWSYAPVGAKVGMPARDLKTMLPDIKPMLGIFDGNQPDDSQTVKDGMYTVRSSKAGDSEAMAYGINGGRVTQVYWSSKMLTALADVQGFRSKLSQMHGESRLGYKAKVTKDGIAKVTTEVFSVRGTGIVISLSSSLGETEVAVLDTSDPQIDLKELYFSFEKQRDRLQQELLRLTKKAPKDETDADCLDVLREAIATQTMEPSGEQSNHEVQTQEESQVDYPQVRKNEEQVDRIGADESSDWGSEYVVFVLVAAFVCMGVFVVIRKAKRKRK
jgi:hypothetical protein